MSNNQEEFLKELLNDFKIEAAEQIQAIVNGLVALEKNAKKFENQDIIEIVFREIHSMKGAARAVNQLHFEQLCMAMEEVFHAMKKGILEVNPGMFDVFYQATDCIETMIGEIDAPHKSISGNMLLQLTGKLQSLLKAKSGTSEPVFGESARNTSDNRSREITDSIENDRLKDDVEATPNDPKPEKSENTAYLPGSETDNKEKNIEHETVRVSTTKLNDILRMAEEMVVLKSELFYQSQQLNQIATQFMRFKRRIEGQITGSEQKDGKSIAEFIREKELLKKHESDLFQLNRDLEQLERNASRSIENLQVVIRQTMLQPFSTLFMIVPRLIRDLSKEYGKEINLEMTGKDIEIDRRILEHMKDPLIHLIRNCIDHGIETTKDRMKQKKPAAGKLTIQVNSDLGQKIKMVISDDGSGIRRDSLIDAALKTGALNPENAKSISEKDLFPLIFTSGLSTSPYITDVSGRGLGMAIVAEKVANIGGNIVVDSVAGQGTTFTITLPQSLATFKGILVRASDQNFLIPTSTVIKAVKININDVKTVESKNTLRLNEETIGLVSLSGILNIRKSNAPRKVANFQVLVLQHAQKKLAFIVDEVLGKHEGIVKTLGRQLIHVNNIAGACIMGDGRIVPVLNVVELLTTATSKSFAEELSIKAKVDKADQVQQKKVLVVEDSITVRNMLRNYLESAGFVVKTAIDGQDGFEKLQTEEFDIGVLDVEMPRMNGFELTKKIRENASLAQMPVILVTALDSQEDRHRGMEAGANAYIVKSSFEKSNLIDTINRLI
jgi:two-component system, chemotaxis family, sensor kinase CheA